ncbi:hypothetical protein KBZ19_08865 [Synechococcus sp. L2F]|uniref:hypothetical protein n=1 Tax=Synechococcus sp. L2F TaxID=2823739 RepID=UPI0020CDDF3F|nr:hypothetical protein [Synechococcus sp. L2F]MCP9828596.1 hypothetical protein [Synechococcus sp. L2F]
MILNQKTLEKLRQLINEETEYRSGPKLVQFFNSLGFSDSYGQGFPSRWAYTDERLARLNGTPGIDQCICTVFAPVNFVGQFDYLDRLLEEFNQYLAFDSWKVVREGADLRFARVDKNQAATNTAKLELNEEDQFLKREFSNLSIDALGLEGGLVDVLNERVKEIERCFQSGAYLAVLILAGSTLEGLLLGIAGKHPRHFNQAQASPKDSDGKPMKFHQWNLNALIDVAAELKIIEHDTKKFSHTLRDFRNYIHPFEQMSVGFSPREGTAKISLQVLKSAIYDIAQGIAMLGV